MYTETDLVSFGNYLLKTYGVNVYSNDGQNVPLYQREVDNADWANWDVARGSEISTGLRLPSHHQLEETAWFSFEPDNEKGLGAQCEILCVHFYPGKVKYDIEVILSDDTRTRLYNVDSVFVTTR